MNLENKKIPAGEFSTWLQSARQVHQLKNIGSDVPCDTCNVCCRSSFFIHIRPSEIQVLNLVPKEYLFPAPGLPEGHVLMGFTVKGECPMFINKRCSIYKYRPQTCRDFDCRVFAATGIELNEKERFHISERARKWKFNFPNELDKKEFTAVRDTARFLKEYKEYLPDKTLSKNPVQLALFAIKVFNVFYKLNEDLQNFDTQKSTDIEIIKDILTTLDKFETL